MNDYLKSFYKKIFYHHSKIYNTPTFNVKRYLSYSKNLFDKNKLNVYIVKNNFNIKIQDTQEELNNC